MPEFEDADAVAEVLTFLRGHPVAREVLGDRPSLSGIAEPPWPHLIVSEGLNADLRNMEWEHEQEVTLELLSDPTGAPGKAAMLRHLMRLARAVKTMPDRDYAPTDVVTANVKPSGNKAFRTLSTGQLSYQLSLLVTVRPPLVS